MGFIRQVDSRDRDIFCFDCREKMRKTEFPSLSWPKDNRITQDQTLYWGRVVCDSCEKYPDSWLIVS